MTSILLFGESPEASFISKTAADRAKYVADRRYFLEQKLGGKCERCGSREDLQFHHVGERTWVARKTSRWRRMVLYEREAAAGEIELLCADCNKTEPNSWWKRSYAQVSDEPLPE